MSEKEKKVMESRSPAPGSLGGLRGEDGTGTSNQEKGQGCHWDGSKGAIGASRCHPGVPQDGNRVGKLGQKSSQGVGAHPVYKKPFSLLLCVAAAHGLSPCTVAPGLLSTEVAAGPAAPEGGRKLAKCTQSSKRERVSEAQGVTPVSPALSLTCGSRRGHR